MNTKATIDEILALEQARLDALNGHDVEAVGRLMADDLVHVHATGLVENLTEFLAGLRALPRQSQRESTHVRICGTGAAIITGHVVNTLTRSGQSVPEQTRLMVTQVVRRDKSTWRFVSFHSCRAPGSEQHRATLPLTEVAHGALPLTAIRSPR